MGLSSPEGASVNDGINPALSYITVDDIADAILQLGRGSLIAKTDIKHAYRANPSPPAAQAPSGYAVAGQLLCGWSPPLWSSLCSTYLYRCSGMGDLPEGSRAHIPLHR